MALFRNLEISRLLLAPLLLAALALSATAAAAAPTISARIQPNQIPLGQDARLQVTISGAVSAPTPRPAPVPGLEIQNLGQTTSMQYVNGAMSSETTNTFLVRPTRVGEFEIPSISIEVGGETLRTQSLTLHVFKPDRVPQVKRTRPQSGQQGRQRQAAPGAANAEGEPQIARLEVAGVPDRELFVGEVIPVEIVLYVREGTRVTEATPPSLVGSGFTLHRPTNNEPAQQRVRLADGVYTKLTFPAALSPITAGDVPLEASIELTARIPKRVPRQRRRFDDPFFDSFFDSFKYRAVDQKLPVVSEPSSVRVAALPEEGRPASFTGGVGRFSIQASAEPTSVAVGDPITLTLSLYGKGNFDRLQFPEPAASESWKTYDPTSDFKAEDALGLSGRKTFEQALLPLSPDVAELPARELSYFDPDGRRYVTLTIDAIPIDVAAAPAAHRPRMVGQRAAGGFDAYELAPNKIEMGEGRTSLTPVATQPWFLALQIFPLAAVGGAIWWGRRRRRLALDPFHTRNRHVQAELKRLFAQMDTASSSGDPTAFFEAARRAVQESVAGVDGAVAASSLTQADVESRLADHPDLQERAREVFTAADALSYGGSVASGGGLPATRDRVSQLVADIGKVLCAILSTMALLTMAAPARADTEPTAAFAAANEAFASGDYETAAARFRALLDEGHISPSVLYDLANADSKAGRFGAAVLGYERALALAPGDPDVLANLRQTRTAANLVEPEPDRLEQIAATQTVDGWAWLAAAALWLGCALAIRHALRAEEDRAPSRALLTTLVVLAAILVAATVLSRARLDQLDRAVVLGPAPALRVAPFDAATISTELVAGQLVDIERIHESFALVRTDDGHAGWMPAAEVQEILPR